MDSEKCPPTLRIGLLLRFYEAEQQGTAELKELSEVTDPSGEGEDSELCDDEQNESSKANDEGDHGNCDDWEDRENDPRPSTAASQFRHRFVTGSCMAEPIPWRYDEEPQGPSFPPS